MRHMGKVSTMMCFKSSFYTATVQYCGSFFCRKMANSEKGMTCGEALTSEKKLLKKIERQKGITSDIYTILHE